MGDYDHTTSYVYMKLTEDLKKNKQDQRSIILSSVYIHSCFRKPSERLAGSGSTERLPSHKTAERKPFIRPNYCGYYQMMAHTPLHARLWAEPFTYITLHNAF